MEGFKVIGMNILSGHRLCGVGMLWIRCLVFRPFGPSGNGGMAGFGKRPCTGGTMVQGPRFATLNRVSALGLDALPVTIGTSPGEQCHNLLLTAKICLCGGA